MTLKLLSHRHSLQLKQHEHTSYGILAILVIMVGIILATFSVSSFVSASPGPASSSISLTGIMPEKPPTVAASISSPNSQQVFYSSPITVSGNCPKNTIVEVFTNNIFAGSTPCTDTGTYSLQISLLYGSNSITSIDYDALNQAGPASQPISVTYNAQAPISDLLSNINFTGTQLILNSQAVFRGTFPGQTVYIPINILGGVPPFAINVEWGDNKNQVIPSNNNTTINASHTYSRPGTYKVTIQASDNQQRIAFLTIAVIVNGPLTNGTYGPQSTNLTSSNGSSSSLSSKLVVLWPMYAISATLVISFWLGEKREKKVLSNFTKPAPKLGHV